jgi:hypothetical protein
LPISEEAYGQLLQLASLLDNLPDSEDKDIWTYIWGSPCYSSSKAYKYFFGHHFVHPIFKWLWKAKAQKKHKVFFRLLLKDRLITQNILRRKNKELPSYDCFMHICSRRDSSTYLHRLPFCSSKGSIQLVIPQGDPIEILESFKNQLSGSFFMDIIILMSWCIWMERNDLIFRGVKNLT